MIEKRRRLNERKFPNWEELPSDGRKYWLEISGKFGFKARYVKEVDNQENTVRFWQEIYNNNGQLVEIHEKYPQDLGHKNMRK